ncbi:MAG: mechanosensitive ion channel family protein [Gemmatimonadetes bacterium]|nr:mechanosensitive ion channel family protein [Gemmatimonadota bacterium]
MTELLENPWVQRLGFVLGGFVLGLVLELVIIRRAHKLAERTRFKWDEMIIGSLRGVGTIWLVAGGVYLALNVGALDPLLVSTTQRVLMVLVLGSVVIAATRAVGGAVEMVSGRAGGAIKSPTLVVNLARMAVGILGLFIILQNLGIDITALITALGIGGIAIALALQDTLGNLFAGIQIIVSKQVRQGDYIRLSSGEEGWVTDVKGRNTTIQTFPDGNLVTVPNSMLASSIVKNLSMPRRALWVTLEVGVSYDSDLEHVEAVALEVAKQVLGEVDGGVPGEDPIVRYHTFGDSSINFDVRMMVREFRSQGPVRHEFIKRLHQRFGDEGIEIPFPIRTVIMQGGQEPPAEGG